MPMMNSSTIAKRRGFLVIASVPENPPMKGLSGEEGSWGQRRPERQPRVFFCPVRGASVGVSPDQEEGDAPEGCPASEVLGFRHWVPQVAKSTQGNFLGARRPPVLRASVTPGRERMWCSEPETRRAACRGSVLGVRVFGNMGAEACREEKVLPD